VTHGWTPASLSAHHSDDGRITTSPVSARSRGLLLKETFGGTAGVDFLQAGYHSTDTNNSINALRRQPFLMHSDSHRVGTAVCNNGIVQQHSNMHNDDTQYNLALK